MNKVGKDDEEDAHFNEEVKTQRSSGSITNHVGTWMNKIEKFSVSAVTRMKTYIKKKEIEEDPDLDWYDEWTIDEDDANLQSTDASKTNSEASPAKDFVDLGEAVKKEVEIDNLKKQEDAFPEKQIEMSKNELNNKNFEEDWKNNQEKGENVQNENGKNDEKDQDEEIECQEPKNEAKEEQNKEPEIAAES